MQLDNSQFIQSLIRECQKHPKRIVFPESDDIRVLEAAHLLLAKRCVQSLWLFGTADSALAQATAAGIPLSQDIESIRWVSSADPVFRSATRDHLEARASKRGKTLAPGVSEEAAAHRLDQAAFLLATHQADAVVAGCIHTTAEVIRASLRGIGLAPETRTVSSCFAMIREQSTLPPLRYIYADCGVVIQPDAEQLADIAASSVETFRALFPELEPHLAFLSFSTKGSATDASTEKMRKALALFRARMPEVKADGELQFDAAFDASIGARKAPDSPVAGKANCFIFPDLNAGNIAYKITQRLADFSAYGPILQGTALPYTDLSRGATADDIFVSALIASLKAQRAFS